MVELNILIYFSSYYEQTQYIFSKRRTPNKHNDVTPGSVADLLGPAAPRPLVPLRVPQLGDDLPLVSPGAGPVRVQRRLQLAALLPCNTSDTHTLVMLRHFTL